MAKPKMSKEEKAVRDALAVVQADTGIEKARQIMQTGVVPQTTITPTPVSTREVNTAEEAIARFSEIKDPNVRAQLEKMAGTLATKTAEATEKYGALGYDYNPVTGATTKRETSPTTVTQPTVSTSPIADIDKQTRDAFAELENTFALYDLAELAPVIAGYMRQGLTSNEAIIELRKNKTYQTRFAGNTKRTAAGLNALTEAEYLSLEDSYSETLRAYGQQTLLGTDRKTRQTKMADIIGGDISPVEFKDRVSTVVTRVENADPLVKSTLRDFYKITDTELVSYFLSPTENLPRLQEKVTAAEIGSAALAQGGLTTDMTSAESLAKFGVDLATARRGYSTISDVLPTATKLSQIYSEDKINYNQKVAEEEVFKGLASAQRKRTQLAEKEIASFQGSSGVGAAGLSTTYLRRGSSAGQF